MEDILSYNILPNSPLYHDDFPTKPVKHLLMTEIENALDFSIVSSGIVFDNDVVLEAILQW